MQSYGEKRKMIEIIKDWIWDIGGFLFTTSLILLVIAYIWAHILNKMIIGWSKEARDNLFYWVQHKKEINKIIEMINKK